jgi:hypothetical protein
MAWTGKPGSWSRRSAGGSASGRPRGSSRGPSGRRDSMIPRHSPRPIRTKPGRSQKPRRITSSPSSRKRRARRTGASAAPCRATSVPAGSRATPSPRRNRAAAQQVAGPEIAAVARVVGEQLGRGPVEIAQVARDNSIGGDPCSRIFREESSTWSVTSNAPRAVSSGCSGRAAAPDPGGPREGGDAERLQRLERDDPGRDRRREVLRQERPQGLVLPRLDVAGRPVVQEAEAEEVLLRPIDGIGSPRRLPVPTKNPPRARSPGSATGRTAARPRVGPALAVGTAGTGAPLTTTTSCGRGSRSERTCSSAAADCRAAASSRRSSRGGSTRRSRCSRRCGRAGAFGRRHRRQVFPDLLALRRPARGRRAAGSAAPGAGSRLPGPSTSAR